MVIATKYRLQIQGTGNTSDMVYFDFDNITQIKSLLKRTMFVQQIKYRLYKVEVKVDVNSVAQLTLTEINW